MSVDFWNKRYQSDSFAYGKAPNQFFENWLSENKYSPGKALFPCEGEGRNAVYAATKGWESSAFDIATEGKRKCEHLAKEQNVVVQYKIEDLKKIYYPKHGFDLIFIGFCHFPPEVKKQLLTNSKIG